MQTGIKNEICAVFCKISTWKPTLNTLKPKNLRQESWKISVSTKFWINKRAMGIQFKLLTKFKIINVLFFYNIWCKFISKTENGYASQMEINLFFFTSKFLLFWKDLIEFFQVFIIILLLEWNPDSSQMEYKMWSLKLYWTLKNIWCQDLEY